MKINRPVIEAQKYLTGTINNIKCHNKNKNKYHFSISQRKQPKGKQTKMICHMLVKYHK